MINTFINELKKETNFTTTENGALAHKTTLSAVYDMFTLGGAYRNRPDEDCILLFKKALEEDEELALKCLFYLRDIRGGQGERRFFKVCFQWLAKEYPEIAKRNLQYIPEYGRWDDIFCILTTLMENDSFELVKSQLKLDLESLRKGENEGVSLLGKWLPSENASSLETKETANRIRQYLGLSHRDYRKMLTSLRKRINIVENLMSRNEWDKIEFDKIPSKAGFIYRNAFAHKDIIANKYEKFINSKETKVNASTLYPYEIVRKATELKEDFLSWRRDFKDLSAIERETLNKYWENQKDYLNGVDCGIMCVVDTSGSMTNGCGNVDPIDVAISLGMYCSERVSGPFKNNFISFSSRPSFIEVEGIDFVDKARRIYKQNLCEDTDLRAVFNLLRDTALKYNVNQEDMPKTIVVISDMEINNGSYWRSVDRRHTEMAEIRNEWTAVGLQMPKLIYWNVNARNNIILDDNVDGVSFISGCSPVIFESVLTDKTGWDLCYEKLMSNRYEKIK